MESGITHSLRSEGKALVINVHISNRHFVVVEKYAFREYDPRVAEIYESEKRKIARALRSDAVVEHVGSTAVPGLGGKGILDILVGVRREEMNAARKRLCNAGYRFRAKASTPQRYFFRRDYPHEGGTRRVHVHLTWQGSWDWRQKITFRNALRRRPEKVVEYAEVKRRAAELAQGDGEIYNAVKTNFILETTKETLRKTHRS